MSKLILVEGLPSSGKSTTAQMVYDNLIKRGVDAEIFLEGNYNHPADFDGYSFFTIEEFDQLKKSYQSSSDILIKYSYSYLDGILLPYKRMMDEEKVELDDSLLHDIFINDIYELDFDLHLKLIQSRWQNFVDSFDGDKTFIFECCFIQNPITITMVRDNRSHQTTKDYIISLADLVKGLDPILIYLEQESIDRSFREVIGKRAEGWYDGFIHYYTHQGYGLIKKLHGLDGTIEVLKEREKRERDIFDSLNIKKYRVDNSQFDMSGLEKSIDKILDDNF